MIPQRAGLVVKVDETPAPEPVEEEASVEEEDGDES